MLIGNFGFSYIGALYLAMLFIPNLLWARRLPKGYSPEGENKTLLLLERIGEVAVTAAALVFTNFNPAPVGLWNLWLLLSFVLMLLYEICWIRYFRHPGMETMYGSFCGIPVPLASLPVAAFLVLSLYGKVILLTIAAILLGIGHIGIHLSHRKQAGIH